MLRDIIKCFVLPMYMGVMSDEDRSAAIDKADAGDETEDERNARIAENVFTDTEQEEMLAKANDGSETEDEKTARLAAGIQTDTEKEAAEAGDDGKGSKTVPHARFNEVVMQRNFYSEENTDLKRRLTIAEAAAAGKDGKVIEEEEGYDYDEAEGRYLEAVKEGKTKDAIQIRREINTQIQADAEANVVRNLNLDERLTEHGTAITESQKVGQFTTEIEQDFPEFQKGHKKFNAELVADTLETYRGLVAGGMPMSKAIVKATTLNAKAAGIDITKKPAAGLSEEATKTAAQRAEEARRRGAGANGQQPPKTAGGKGGAGGKHLNVDEIDVETLTDEEFNALPEATKKKLRGDTVE